MTGSVTTVSSRAQHSTWHSTVTNSIKIFLKVDVKKKKDNGHSLVPCRVRWGLEELVGTETVDSVSFVVVVPAVKPPPHS